MTQLSCPAIHTSSAALDSAGCALGTARRHLAHPAMGLLREFCGRVMRCYGTQILHILTLSPGPIRYQKKTCLYKYYNVSRKWQWGPPTSPFPL